MPKKQRKFVESCAIQFFESGASEQNFKTKTGLSIRGMQALLPVNADLELKAKAKND